MGGSTLSNDACVIRCSDDDDCPDGIECGVWEVCAGQGCSSDADCGMEGWECYPDYYNKCYMPCEHETNPCPSGWVCTTSTQSGTSVTFCGWDGY